MADAATVAHKVDVLRGHCEALGRDPAEGRGQPVEHARPHRQVRGGDGGDTREFLREATGQDPTTSDIGTPDELVARIEELAAAGVQYFIFNMPTGSPDTVRQVGELLIGRLGD